MKIVKWWLSGTWGFAVYLWPRLDRNPTFGMSKAFDLKVFFGSRTFTIWRCRASRRIHK